MTEQQWLTSTNPAEMFEYCRDRVTPEQMRCFVEACRNEYDKHSVDVLVWELSDWRAAFMGWIRQSTFQIVPLEVRANILRSIVPYSNRTRTIRERMMGAKCRRIRLGPARGGYYNDKRMGNNMSKTIREIVGWNVNELTIERLEAYERELKQRWTEEYESLKKQVDELRANLRLHEEKANGEYWVWQGDGHDHLESLVCPILIPAEKFRQRDATERERVKQILSEWCKWGGFPLAGIIESLYSLPESVELPAGIYLEIYPGGPELLLRHNEPFTPIQGREYRRLVYADDSPSEVTNRVELKVVSTGCGEPEKPLFEEWASANVEAWDDGYYGSWYRSSDYVDNKFRNVPDAVFAELVRNVPNAVFVELEGDILFANSTEVIYRSSQAARDALKAALLKLKMVRE